MKMKPEAFWFWRKGEFDDEKFQGDLSERIPKLYEQHGLIDAQVVKDTLLVDHSNGKGMLQVTVDEGQALQGRHDGDHRESPLHDR